MLRKGIVVETHPEDYSVDLVMADDGSRMVGVQVLTSNSSTRTGTVDMPKIKPTGNKWDVTKRTGQDMEALVATYDGHPVVVGFIYPQVSQMTFRDNKFRLFRHQSDVIEMIDGDGNIDLRHPSGMAIRIGQTPDHYDPKLKNEDKTLVVDRNTEKKPYIRITMADVMAQLTIAPDGQVTLTTEAGIDVTAKKDINIHSDTHIHLTAPRIDFN